MSTESKGLIELVNDSDQNGSSVYRALEILSTWGYSVSQKQHILSAPESVLLNCHCDSLGFTPEQLVRADCVLTIDSALRILFENPTNISGFMTMPNYNPGFEGATPMELIDQGDLGTLTHIAKRIQALAHIGW